MINEYFIEGMSMVVRRILEYNIHEYLKYDSYYLFNYNAFTFILSLWAYIIIIWFTYWMLIVCKIYINTIK